LVGHNVVSNSHVCLVEGCFVAVDMCVNENALFCYFVEYLRHCSATLNGSTFIHTNHSFHHCPKFPPKGSSRSQIASLKHFLKWPWLCHNALVREKWSIVVIIGGKTFTHFLHSCRCQDELSFHFAVRYFTCSCRYFRIGSVEAFVMGSLPSGVLVDPITDLEPEPGRVPLEVFGCLNV